MASSDTKNLPIHLDKEAILKDYQVCVQSRMASLVGRKEVLSGKAKFGIFGDGKELAQVALSHFCKPGDWRTGYYRDQTLLMALGICNTQEFFSQLYSDTDVKNEPASCGRQMNAHFATRYLDENQNWKSQLETFNVAADLSPTASQMPRLVGLSYASKYYKEQSENIGSLGKKFSSKGNEIAIGTIGNASTSEGIFWESLNAIGVLKIPAIICVWDDGYGISVPNEYQTTKNSISKILEGFQYNDNEGGIHILKARGWNFPELLEVFKKAEHHARDLHQPALVHITEMTQPQGHSTSGSHERYKSKERLQWEEDFDCISKFADWITTNNVAEKPELEHIRKTTELELETARQEAWQNYQSPLISLREKTLPLIQKQLEGENSEVAMALSKEAQALSRAGTVMQRAIHALVRKCCYHFDLEPSHELSQISQELAAIGKEKYQTLLHTEKKFHEGSRPKPSITSDAQRVDGREVIQKFFDYTIEKDPRVFVIGEDIGTLGGVNLEFEGLQKKHGLLRVTDTGIREATILGQGIGAAIRGLRPIVDIQYLDYLLYCIQGISDDLATLSYRTKGGQAAPVIVRTKGHRLEGIWHTGSPISMILGAVRGCYLCVPRDGVRAAGFYRTLLDQNDPGIVIEVLNGYRVKESLPENIGEYGLPLGEVELLREGKDITVVTYGACVKLAQTAADELAKLGIEIELIDAQTLLPFDTKNDIVASISKTGAILFLDEDVPGGATSYMMQQVLDKSGGHDWLDSTPKCLSAMPNRSGYGSDADYYCKPSTEDIVESVLELLS